MTLESDSSAASGLVIPVPQRCGLSLPTEVQCSTGSYSIKAMRMLLEPETLLHQLSSFVSLWCLLCRPFHFVRQRQLCPLELDQSSLAAILPPQLTSGRL